ncbi:OsmC family protein [Vineibacter terrae]|uniref:OsmC family protein n=1 Tax=Vineibacter terrae TaxID=2586908 RepID=UPI002E373FEB|nr:OsmC family protein [Vineibacter terrae]HEX2889911.1 OsmC family protein [Vineibacter terrae]
MATVHLENASGFEQRIRARTHRLTADEPTDVGGTDSGPAPYELLLASLAACTALTLRLYVARKAWALGRIEIDARFVREADGTERIEREVRVQSTLDEQQLGRLADICEKTPVTRTLKRSMAIATRLISKPDVS